MAVIEVGNIYISTQRLAGVSDVREVPPPSEGMKPSYTFKIYLEGSATAVTTQSKAEAVKLHELVHNKMSPQFRYATGGTTIMYPAVNTIGPVGDDPVVGDKFEAAFTVQMDGVSIVLQYVDFAAATKARGELVTKINGG